MVLALLPTTVFAVALVALFLWMYQRQGSLGLVKLVLVLIGATSGLLWVINLKGPHGSTQLNELLSLLPWGTVWIVDTVVLAVFFAFTLRKQDTEAA